MNHYEKCCWRNQDRRQLCIYIFSLHKFYHNGNYFRKVAATGLRLPNGWVSESKKIRKYKIHVQTIVADHGMLMNDKLETLLLRYFKHNAEIPEVKALQLLCIV